MSNLNSFVFDSRVSRLCDSTSPTNPQNNSSLRETISLQNLLIGKWDLYYHLPYDKNWDIASYKRIMEDIDSVEKLVLINEFVK